MRGTVALAALLLAACSQGTDRDADGKLTSQAIKAEASKLVLRPGHWETTTLITDMQVPGLTPDMLKAATGTRTTTRNCVSQAQAARPDPQVFTGRDDVDCTYQRFSLSGAKIDAAMTCRPPAAPGTVALTLAGNHSPTAFAMGMTMNTQLPGAGGMTVKATVSGRHLGACTAGEKTG